MKARRSTDRLWRAVRPAPTTGGSRGGELVLSGVTKEFVHARTGQELLALGGVDLVVEPGQFVAIVGPSGCGKTTLLKVIAGMLPPTSGHVSIEGSGERRGSIGFVFQHASLYPWRTLLDNVGFGLELATRSAMATRRRRQTRARAAELLALVGLKGFERFYPREVSGGMQQRTNLARALAIEPSVLLMDEPFSALDAQTREELQVELQRIAVAASTTIVFVTHDIREATYLADRVVVLSERPGTVKAIVDVTTPRPRPFDYQVSPEFLQRSNEIWQLVHADRSASADAREPAVPPK